MASELKQTVAIVDDDPSIRRSIGNLLRSKGLQVVVFDSAEVFLASPERRTAGCVVLDLRMPGMNGLDLLQALAPEEALRVVVLTAHGDEEARRQMLQAGAFAFLTKPFRADVLIDTVTRALSNTDRTNVG